MLENLRSLRSTLHFLSSREMPSFGWPSSAVGHGHLWWLWGFRMTALKGSCPAIVMQEQQRESEREEQNPHTGDTNDAMSLMQSPGRPAPPDAECRPAHSSAEQQRPTTTAQLRDTLLGGPKQEPKATTAATPAQQNRLNATAEHHQQQHQTVTRWTRRVPAQHPHRHPQHQPQPTART